MDEAWGGGGIVLREGEMEKGKRGTKRKKKGKGENWGNMASWWGERGMGRGRLKKGKKKSRFMIS